MRLKTKLQIKTVNLSLKFCVLRSQKKSQFRSCASFPSLRLSQGWGNKGLTRKFIHTATIFRLILCYQQNKLEWYSKKQ